MAVCIAASLSITVLASADVIGNDSDGVYHIELSANIINGGAYVLLVAPGTEDAYDSSYDAALYIDRETAANGTVQFSFVPMKAVPAVVLLYGTFSGGVKSPVLVGLILPTGQFADIKGSWAEDSVNYMTGSGYMAGVSNTAFAPDATMTRAMLVTVLYRIAGQPKVDASNSFADVASDTWYTNAVAWASQNKIVSGYSATEFGTNDQVTREQISAILYNYATYKGYDTTSKADLSGFIDAFKISSWALSPVSWASAKGILSGITSTTLVPADPASRAQVAVMLSRFLRNVAA